MKLFRRLKQLNRYEWSEVFYFLFFGLLFFAKGIGLYDGQKWFLLFLFPAVVSWTLKMLTTSWNMKEIILVLIILAVAGISSIISKDKSAIIAMMIVVGVKDIKLDRFWRFCLCVWTMAFWGAVVLSLLGLWPSVRLMHKKAGIGFVLRDSLGMTHPNVLFISYMIFISLLFLVFRWKGKQAIWPIILTCVGGAFIFLYAFSYTGLMCLLAFVFFLAYFSLERKRSRLENGLLLAVMPFSVLFSLVTPFLIGRDGKVYYFFYKVFNTRFYMTRAYLEKYGISLFGQEISQAGSWSADCSYLYGLLTYGVLLFLILLILLFGTIKRLISDERSIELAIVLSFCIAGIMEPFMFNFSFKNLMYPLMGCFAFALFSKNSIFYGEEKETAFIVFFKEIGRFVSSKWKVLFSGFVIGALVGVILSPLLVHYEPYIIINRSQSDYVVDKQTYEIFGELDQDIINQAWILGIDTLSENAKDEKCYVFEGKPIGYITLRSKITLSLAVGLAATILVGAGLSLKNRRNIGVG